MIEIGKYHLKYFEDETALHLPELEKTMLLHSPFAGKQLHPDVPPTLGAPTNIEPFPNTLSPEIKARQTSEPHYGTTQHAALKVLSGKQTGVEIPLTKPLTAIGKKGVQVVMITRRPNGFFLNHVQGAKFPIVNGATLNERPCPLNPEDVIELSGVRIRFLAK